MVSTLLSSGEGTNPSGSGRVDALTMYACLGGGGSCRAALAEATRLFLTRVRWLQGTIIFVRP